MSAFEGSWHYVRKTFSNTLLLYKGGLFERIDKDWSSFQVLNFLFSKHLLALICIFYNSILINSLLVQRILFYERNVNFLHIHIQIEEMGERYARLLN
ncbi:hypothetical protein ABH17_019330 [Bacillus toyonensis]|nr:hypothetical protein ABH17_019330 [Bacillus toyonensis]